MGAISSEGGELGSGRRERTDQVGLERSAFISRRFVRGGLVLCSRTDLLMDRFWLCTTLCREARHREHIKPDILILQRLPFAIKWLKDV